MVSRRRWPTWSPTADAASASPPGPVLRDQRVQLRLSVWDVFGALSAGAAVVLPDADRPPTPNTGWRCASRPASRSGTRCRPSSRCSKNRPRRAANALDSLRLVMMSGDRIPPTLPAALRALCRGRGLVAGRPDRDDHLEHPAPHRCLLRRPDHPVRTAERQQPGLHPGPHGPTRRTGWPVRSMPPVPGWPAVTGRSGSNRGSVRRGSSRRERLFRRGPRPVSARWHHRDPGPQRLPDQDQRVPDRGGRGRDAPGRDRRRSSRQRWSGSPPPGATGWWPTWPRPVIDGRPTSCRAVAARAPARVHAALDDLAPACP